MKGTRGLLAPAPQGRAPRPAPRERSALHPGRGALRAPPLSVHRSPPWYALPPQQGCAAAPPSKGRLGAPPPSPKRGSAARGAGGPFALPVLRGRVPATQGLLRDLSVALGPPVALWVPPVLLPLAAVAQAPRPLQWPRPGLRPPGSEAPYRKASPPPAVNGSVARHICRAASEASAWLKTPGHFNGRALPPLPQALPRGGVGPTSR